MKSITERMAAYIYKLEFDDLPSKVIETTKLFIADFYSASIAGCKANEDFNSVNFDYYSKMGGTKEASVLFSNIRIPACNAAYINALYAHGADMDDGNKVSAGHIGTHVIPAVFALAEKNNSNWKDIIVSINVGYELFNRIAGAAQPSLYKKGYHSTGVAGGLACAGACSKLLHLESNKIYDAISIATVQSSGLIIIDETGQSCKPINPANASKIGVISTELASMGIDAPKNPLESKKGWFNAFSDEINESIIFDGLGKKYTICDSYLKQYPTCRHIHSCIDAAIELRKNCEIKDIRKIEIFLYASAIRSAGNISVPQNEGEAKFSIKYAVAVALKYGFFSLSDLTNLRLNESIIDLINKITLIEDATMENREKGIRGCKMVITTTTDSFKILIKTPKGEGDNFLSWNDMKMKIDNCLTVSDLKISADNLIDKCKNINLDETFKTINYLI